MTNLISGKEALVALANGESVEYTNSCTPSWHELSVSCISINEIISPKFSKFRLKPRTITINSIEVPAPFKPKEGETYWFITDSECGYNCVENKEGCRVGIAAWCTEDEIQQVVAALRQVFGRSDDAVNAARGGK